MEILSLLDPRRARIKGEFTFPHETNLNPGQWVKLQNVRISEGIIEVRKGFELVYDALDKVKSATNGGTGDNFTSIDSVVYRGSALLQSGLYVAYRCPNYQGGKTICFQVDGSYNFKAITRNETGSGSPLSRNGLDQHFPTDGEVTFEEVQTAEGDRAIVMQNGQDAPRVFRLSDPFASMPIVSPPTPEESRVNVLLRPYNFLNVSGTITITNSSARFQAVQTKLTGAGDNERYLEFTVGNTLQNDNVIVEQTGAWQSPNSEQFWILFETSYPLIFNNIRIEFWDGTGWVTGYDPVLSDKEVIFEVVSSGYVVPSATIYLMAFPFWSLPVAVKENGALKMRFVYLASRTNAPTITFQVYLLATGGWVRGGSLWALTNYSSQSLSESAPTVITPVVFSPGEVMFRANTQNASQSGTLLRNVKLPNTSTLFYAPLITHVLPKDEEVRTGSDTLRLYRREEGETEYFLAEVSQYGSYNVETNRLVSSSGYSIPYRLYDTAQSHRRKYNALAPTPGHVVMPTGKVMRASGERLWIGNTKTGAEEEKGAVWVSEYRQPFRFSRTVRVELDDKGFSPVSYSAHYLLFSGEEVRGFAVAPGWEIKTDAVYILTSGSVWLTENMDTKNIGRPRRVSNWGVSGRRSFLVYGNVLIYLDSFGYIRVIGQRQAETIGSGVVEDITTGDTRRAFSSMVVFNSRLYTTFSVSGESESRHALILDWRYGGFVEDFYPFSARNFLVRLNELGAEDAMWVFTDNKLYQFEKSDTDDGIPIEVILTPAPVMASSYGELSGRSEPYSIWERVGVRRVGIVARTGTGVTLTVTRKNHIGVVASDTIALPPGVQYRWSGTTGVGNRVSLDGLWVLIEIAGAMKGGDAIMSLVAEADVRKEMGVFT